MRRYMRRYMAIKNRKKENSKTMKTKIVETSLNLRVEKSLGKMNTDYLLSKDIAEEQLKLEADIYCNVEYMECENAEYMKLFEKAGYSSYVGLDINRRGIMCMVRKEYLVKIIKTLDDPHMMHIQIKMENRTVDIITVRILISNSDETDYIDRRDQWVKILDYIDSVENKEYLIITGDFNHGVISKIYKDNQPRRFFNYQMIEESLKKRNIGVASIKGMSYKNYMKIDHFCMSRKIRVEEAKYVDLFCEHKIGVPDHKLIAACVEI